LPLKPIINSTHPVEFELKTDNELEKSNNLTPIILLETIQIKTKWIQFNDANKWFKRKFKENYKWKSVLLIC